MLLYKRFDQESYYWFEVEIPLRANFFTRFPRDSPVYGLPSESSYPRMESCGNGLGEKGSASNLGTPLGSF
jgi:hypothetical protein